MRSAASFVSGIHRRAAVLRRKRDKKQIMILTVLNTGLLAALVLLIGSPHRIASFTMAGTSLLDDSIGGYVAVAVLSFMLGAALTFFLREHLKKKAARDQVPQDENKQV
ncbi:MAG: hypothetical protein J5722_04220 [Oscillospiraceae bacterium]|nr:hypothetical protein [Oscillospiraceae bacterium]